MASDWSSLGGYGRTDARMPLPVGRTNNTGALGMIMQALLRQGAMKAAPQPQPMPEDDPELARLLAEAFGMAPQTPSAGARGY